MFTFVLICNGVICVLNCYLFWQLLKLRKTLRQLGNYLEKLEKKFPLLLKIAIFNLRQSEYKTLTVRKQYELLQQKKTQILNLVQFLNWLYKKYRASTLFKE